MNPLRIFDAIWARRAQRHAPTVLLAVTARPDLAELGRRVDALDEVFVDLRADVETVVGHG
jgi:hypothetical protein